MKLINHDFVFSKIVTLSKNKKKAQTFFHTLYYCNPFIQLIEVLATKMNYALWFYMVRNNMMLKVKKETFIIRFH